MADGTDFSFETLSKAEAIERKQPKLQRLEPSFWDQLQGYLNAMEANVRKEQERNPTSRKIALLHDELRNATRKSESLWEAREKKVTLHALKNSRAQDAPPPENALRSEQELYQELLRAYRAFVPRVITALEKPVETGKPGPGPMPGAAPPSPPAPAPATRVAPPPPETAGTAKAPEESLTVRALVDVPPFVGLDGRTYRLKKGDVLTLPKKMVDMLAKRGQVAVMA
ncbi:MAG: hypothetical protein HYT80_03690 [Euryarchaeota archaeon]|nr:hypothetical protein [Euryarchaeota archaeon]